MQVSPDRVRIPDVTLTGPDPQPDVAIKPPVLVVEILSPDDTYSDMQERAKDYLSMGVKMIWIIDPQSRTGRMCVGPSWTEARRLEVPGTGIYVELDEIFSKINQM